MPLTKADIVQNVAQSTGMPKHKFSDLVEQLTEIVMRSLASGEDVLISGFGKFSVRNKSERRGRNPATGEAMRLSARRVVTFKYSGKLRKRCNGAGCKASD